MLPDDVQAVTVSALAHRLVVRPDPWMCRVDAEGVVRAVLTTVPVPGMDDA